MSITGNQYLDIFQIYSLLAVETDSNGAASIACLRSFQVPGGS